MPLLRFAARAYVAGDTLEDALRCCRKLLRDGMPATIGFFDSDTEDTPQTVLRQYLDAIHEMDGTGAYLSIKLPALGFSHDMLDEVAASAAEHHTRLHFDALWPESADQTLAMVQRLAVRADHPPLGYTLPGRWRRSIDDAGWAAVHGLAVRVVKGQWEAPADATRDLRQGFIEVVEHLAGRVPLVAVASHDTAITEPAIRCLRAAGTTCELELLWGLPMRESLAMARRLNVPVRAYIPYGKAHLPYAVARAVEHPHLIAWLIKDLFASAIGR